MPGAGFGCMLNPIGKYFHDNKGGFHPMITTPTVFILAQVSELLPSVLDRAFKGEL